MIHPSLDRLVRGLRMLPWATGVLCRHGMPKYFVEFEAGIGDSLLCSVICRELRKRGVRGIWVSTPSLALFENNPDVDRVGIPDLRVNSIAANLGARRVDPAYNRYEPASDRHIYQPGHQIAAMCHNAGLTGEVALRPYLYLTAQESSAGRLVTKQVVIQSSVAAARYPILNKEWFHDRFAEVARNLAGRFELIQVGSAQDPLLPGVLDLRGKSTLRETGAILSQSLLFIGLEGFLMHLARAVECPSIIVYGGHTHPDHTGYSANKNLFSAVPCAPCWLRSTCNYEHECMRQIRPADVLAAIDEQVAKAGTKLSEDLAALPLDAQDAGWLGQASIG